MPYQNLDGKPCTQSHQKLVDYELDIALIEGKTLHPELISSQFSSDEIHLITSLQKNILQLFNIWCHILQIYNYTSY